MRFLLPCILAVAGLHAQPLDLLEQANILSNEGSHAAAADLLKQASSADPGNESISFRLASALVFSRRHTEARVLLDRLSKSWNPEMAAMAASSLTALDRAEERERAAKAKPPSAAQLKAQRDYLERKARLDRRQTVYDLLASGEDENALTSIESLERKNEATPDLLREKAGILGRMGRTSEAIAILSRLAESENSSKETQLQLASLLMKEGKTREAFQIWSDLREEYGDAPEGRQAAMEIDALAAPYNLDRWSWGELDLYASYLQRFNIGVANGRLRQGTFVPGARWIEPFVQIGRAHV